eukprot:m.160972 g.160972  ORF g.160972 m.160972 type:complete len:101 (+) comp17632_c0_seq1:68-370(+)
MDKMKKREGGEQRPRGKKSSKRRRTEPAQAETTTPAATATAAARPRRVPEVVVFNDPTARSRSLSRTQDTATAQELDVSDRQLFKKIESEVLKLGKQDRK